LRTGSGGRLRTWSLVTGEALASESYPDPYSMADVEEQDSVDSIAYSPDGSCVALSIAPSVYVRILGARTHDVRSIVVSTTPFLPFRLTFATPCEGPLRILPSAARCASDA
jgi:hypothetical protein